MAWLVVGVAACSLSTDLDDLNDQSEGSSGTGGNAGTKGGGGSGPGGSTGGGATGGGGSVGAGGDSSDGGRGPGGGGGGEDAPTLKFIQSASALVEQERTTLSASMAPTTEGTLVVVAVTINSDPTAKVISVADDGGNLYESANHRSTNDDCTDATEIWYAKKVRGGAQAVTITASTNVRMDTWVLEFAGLSPTDPLDVGAQISDQPEDSLVAAPEVKPSTPRAVIVSTVQTCDGITGIRSPNPFKPLSVQTQNNTAFYIASELGSYGAVWNAGGTWNASTVAFK